MTALISPDIYREAARVSWEETEDPDNAYEEVLEAVAPLIVADELQRIADELHELRQSIQGEAGRGPADSVFAEGIALIRNRAQDLRNRRAIERAV